MDRQQISQGQPHVFFSAIQFYLNSLIGMSLFTTSINVIFGLPLCFFVP